MRIIIGQDLRTQYAHRRPALRCRSILFRKSTLLFILLLASLNLLIGFATAAEGDINPGPLNYYTGCAYGCTANDVQGVSFTVVDGSGNPLECMECSGETASAYIDVGFVSTATTRYNIFFLFGLDKNGDGVITLTSDPVQMSSIG